MKQIIIFGGLLVVSVCPAYATVAPACITNSICQNFPSETILYDCNDTTACSCLTVANQTKNNIIKKATAAWHPSCSNTSKCGCHVTYTYICAKNYFGNPTSFDGSCTRCWESEGAVTATEGTTSPTGCYIPKGTVRSNTYGTYKYTADCHYTE